MRFAVALAVLASLWAIPAAADLYRWVDPETGSVKFSSYPPPWFGDAAKQRGPKVEVIPPGKPATAFEPARDADRDRAAPQAADVPQGDRRGALLKQLAQKVGALVAAAPETAERAFVEVSESLQELERLDKQSKPANPKEEAARFEEKWQLAVPLEARRLALMQQISGLRPPPPDAAPEAIASAWRTTQLQVAALGWTNEAFNAIDPRKLNARHFEFRALTEKISEVWEPYVGRRDLGR